MRIKFPNGMRYGFNSANERICVGAMMGRANELPVDIQAPCKLRLIKSRMPDGVYDEGGAYWGYSPKGGIYWAVGYYPRFGFTGVNIWVRARNRDEAKQKVREILPNARFYR